VDRYFTEGIAEFVMAQFPHNFAGVCVDVGAYHPLWSSNSWIFEQVGWETYCIEPNPNRLPDLIKMRKNVIPVACSDKNENQVDFYIYKTYWTEQGPETQNLWMSDGAFTGLIKYKDTDKTSISEVVKVDVRTLNDIFTDYNISNVDYISIDVERNEMAVLRGLDLTKWKPTIIVIENELNLTDQHGWLSSYGYKCIHRIGVNDIYRLFF
jgi:FkbM family methyltransferase